MINATVVLPNAGQDDHEAETAAGAAAPALTSQNVPLVLRSAASGGMHVSSTSSLASFDPDLMSTLCVHDDETQRPPPQQQQQAHASNNTNETITVATEPCDENNNNQDKQVSGNSTHTYIHTLVLAV